MLKVGTSVSRLAHAFGIIATVVAPAEGSAQAQHVGGSDYVRRVWTTEHGLPTNSVTAILQTPDGFLWVGTFGGLARFDGARFELFGNKNTPALESDRIVGLFPDDRGGFWVISEQSDVAHYDGKTFRAYNRGTGAPVDRARAAWLDRDGSYWMAGEGLIHHARDGRVMQRFAAHEGVPNGVINQIVRDDRGAYLFAADSGLLILRPGSNAVTHVGDDLTGGRVVRFAPRRAGGWWVVGERGITIWENGALRDVSGAPPPGVRGSDAAEAPDGTLWIATANLGVEQWKDGRSTRLPLETAPGVDARTRAIFVDREENVWFAPNGGGLVRLSPARVTSLGKAEGLWRDDVWSVVQDRAGVMWISAWMLHRLRNGQLDTIPGFSSVTALHPDADGSLWVGHEHGVSRLHAEARDDYAIDPPMRANAIRSIFRDRRGRVFAGRNGGVLELKNGRMVDAFDGALREARGVGVITQDRAGALYFGGADGLRVFRDGRWTRYTTADGLGHDQVRNVYEDARGAIWVATYGGGLSRLANGRITRVGADQGLIEDVVSRILDDGAGYFWLSGNRGISRVSRAELNAAADDTSARVAPVLFTVADGMPTNETEGWISWAGWRAADGKLWFPTVKGLAIIDPSRRHTRAPPVAVTDVFADGTRLPEPGGLRARPGDGNLEIRYTAPSFAAPEKVRFKYRLDGFEDQWTDPGTRRTAFYTHVPPGTYTFRVIAANDDGVWNNSGAALTFTIEPHFYQRTTVRLIALLVVLGIVTLGVRWRIRRLQERVRREQAVAERLRQVDKLKDEFLANTSHELRTPLNGIIGLAESLLAGVAGRLDQRIGDDLALIASSGHRLSRLVSDLLDLSRLRHRDLVLRPSAVDVRSAANVVLTLARPLVSGKSVSLVCDVAPGLPPVRADEDRLQQILLNLVENAIKFTPQGTVTISANVVGDMVEVGVADTGIGIAPEHHDRIFEPFTQADASMTRRFGGTGLGLSVTRQLVELHGGTIRVASAAGTGARFAFTLPSAVDSNGNGIGISQHSNGHPQPQVSRLTDRAIDRTPSPIQDASPNGASPAAGRVLVVDDDAINARVLGSFLALGHYVTEVVSNGPDAVAAALRPADAPDLVLLDVMMPGLDGFAVCEQIRVHRGIEELPIILVTARSAVSDLVAGLAAGANDFLAKPIARDELLTRVRTHLALREANRELRSARDTLEDQVRERTAALQTANQRLGQLNRELEEVNRELGTANAGMQSILDQLRTGVIATDPAGQVTFVSRTAEQIIERTAEDAVGCRWDSLITVDAVDRAALRALVAAPADRGEQLATRLHAARGRRYWVQIEVQDDPRPSGGRIIFLSDVSDLYDLPVASGRQGELQGLVGESPHMQMIAKEIRDIARTDTTVLIEGETGTGKELVARAVHASSGRAGGPFIALNCAGLAESILAGQLFGHRRGAFTGAVTDQLGLIEAASGGTLFLDEIGDIPLGVQATLLRALQEREIVRLGETRARKVDVRVIAATHRDLRKRVAEGAFRDDFLYRIRVARVTVPPLRDRIGDLPLLVSTFLRQIAERSARQLEISSEAMEFLTEHAWPGNVRELRAALEHAALKCRGSVIRPGDLPPEILAPSPWTAERAVPTLPDARQQLIDALARTGGNRSAAARLLGISRPTLYARLRALGLIES